MKLLLDFIGEPDSKFTFENDQNKGFSCLKEPLPFCLNPAKGNSRKEDVYDIYKDKITVPILNNLRNNVGKNLDLAGLKSFSSKEAICKNKTKRFQWASRFICPLGSRMIQNSDDQQKFESVSLTDYPSSFEPDWTDRKGMILYKKVHYELHSYNFSILTFIFISLVILGIISWLKTLRFCSMFFSSLELISPGSSRTFLQTPKRLEENHLLLNSDYQQNFQLRKLSINSRGTNGVSNAISF
jgi:hypothetical protein